MPTAVEVNPVPGPGWNAQGAFSFPAIWSTVAGFRAPDSALSTSTFVTIFFEETACCNMLQQGTPVAVGPGQFQVSEDIGVRFFSSTTNRLGVQLDSSRTLYGVRGDLSVFKRIRPVHPELQELTTSRVLSDNDFSVKMHVKMFEWIQYGLSDGKKRGADGLLSAQTGNNAKAIDGFQRGSTALDQMMAPDPNMRPGMSDDDRAAYIKKRRSQWIDKLNIARNGFRGNPIPEKQFTKFWEFFLPDDFLVAPTSYIAHGF